MKMKEEEEEEEEEKVPMIQSLILGSSNSWSHFLCITKIFHLVSKLGFSDINMSATYAKKGPAVLLTCDNLTG